MVFFILFLAFVLLVAILQVSFRVLIKLFKNSPQREVGLKMSLTDFFMVSCLILISISVGSIFGNYISEIFSENESNRVFISMGVLHSLVIASMLLFIKKSECKPKFFLKNVNISKIAIGSAGYFFGIISLILLVSICWNFLLINFGVKIEQQEVVEYFKGTTGCIKYFALFSVMVIAPISEELVFRGLIYGGLKNRIGAIFSAIIVSIVFAAIHFSLPAFLPIFFLSLILIAVYERYGDLRASMFVHSLFNALMSLSMFLEKYVN